MCLILIRRGLEDHNTTNEILTVTPMDVRSSTLGLVIVVFLRLVATRHRKTGSSPTKPPFFVPLAVLSFVCRLARFNQTCLHHRSFPARTRMGPLQFDMLRSFTMRCAMPPTATRGDGRCGSASRKTHPIAYELKCGNRSNGYAYIRHERGG